MANLVVCADGTWMTPGTTINGVPVVSNVVKIHGAVAKEGPDGLRQEVYYHPGVGSGGDRLARFLGGSTGKGLSANIMSGYRWLAGKYRPGDNIYVFGFSRGAYTVRSMAGMITIFGLLDLSDPGLDDAEVWRRVNRVFDEYRKDREVRRPIADLPFHNSEIGMDAAGTTPVHFIGVWDTVGSLGIPDDMAVLNLFDVARDHSFHDTSLSPHVRHARHAVAVDEWRQYFMPTFWTDLPPEADVKQYWFTGAHGDVGGGYLDSGLSDIALRWMIEEAAACGLAFRAEALDQVGPGDPRTLVHDSVMGIFARLKTRPRPVAAFVGDITGVGAERKTGFHPSVMDRWKNPPLGQSDYWPCREVEADQPVTVPVYAAERWNRTGLFLREGVAYRLSAEGQWIDGSLVSGPEGISGGGPSFGRFLQGASSAWGRVETLWKKATGNRHADFSLTRREEQWPWFALVGVVANDGDTVPGDDVPRHQTFLIGDGSGPEAMRLVPKQDGFLYAYANDAWAAYGNNRGSVRLTVERI